MEKFSEVKICKGKPEPREGNDPIFIYHSENIRISA